MAKQSRTRRSRRFSVGKREYVWSTRFGVQLSVPTAGVFQPELLVDRNDWARQTAGTLEKGAVIVRVVGNVHFYMPAPAAVTYLREEASCFAGLLVRDTDDASAPDVNTDAFEENWMRLEHGYMSREVNNVVTLAWALETQVNFNWDVGVKRKITSEESLTLQLTSIGSLAATPACVYLLKTLIQLP